MTSRTIQLIFFFTMFAIAAVLGFLIFKPYINILILAATFAIIFYSFYLKILRWLGGRHPGISALITILAILIIVFVPLTFLGFRVFHEAQGIVNQIGTANANEMSPLGDIKLSSNPTLAKFQQQFEGFLTQATAGFGDLTQKFLDWITNNAGPFFQSVANIGLGIFLWFLALYYFLRDGHKLKGILVSMSPLSDRYDEEILKKIRSSVRSVIGGSLIVAIVQGILAGIGFWIFGIPNPALWGTVAILAALIPTIGTGLITLPAVAYVFLTGSTTAAIGFLIWGIAVVGTVDNFLRPKLIERGIQVHPFLILLSVLGGIAVFGPMGFLTGPIVLTLLSEFLSIYQHLVLQKEA